MIGPEALEPICREHAEQILKAIVSYGLADMMANSPEDAIYRAAHGDNTIFTFDPVTHAIAVIILSAVGHLGITAMTTRDECPVCMVKEAHKECNEPSCEMDPDKWCEDAVRQSRIEADRRLRTTVSN